MARGEPTHFRAIQPTLANQRPHLLVVGSPLESRRVLLYGSCPGTVVAYLIRQLTNTNMCEMCPRDGRRVPLA